MQISTQQMSETEVREDANPRAPSGKPPILLLPPKPLSTTADRSAITCPGQSANDRASPKPGAIAKPKPAGVPSASSSAAPCASEARIQGRYGYTRASFPRKPSISPSPLPSHATRRRWNSAKQTAPARIGSDGPISRSTAHGTSRTSNPLSLSPSPALALAPSIRTKANPATAAAMARKGTVPRRAIAHPQVSFAGPRVASEGKAAMGRGSVTAEAAGAVASGVTPAPPRGDAHPERSRKRRRKKRSSSRASRKPTPMPGQKSPPAMGANPSGSISSASAAIPPAVTPVAGAPSAATSTTRSDVASSGLWSPLPVHYQSAPHAPPMSPTTVVTETGEGAAPLAVYPCTVAYVMEGSLTAEDEDWILARMMRTFAAEPMKLGVYLGAVDYYVWDSERLWPLRDRFDLRTPVATLGSWRVRAGDWLSGLFTVAEVLNPEYLTFLFSFLCWIDPESFARGEYITDDCFNDPAIATLSGEMQALLACCRECISGGHHMWLTPACGPEAPITTV